jgi:hypothetical protein
MSGHVRDRNAEARRAQRIHSCTLSASPRFKTPATEHGHVLTPDGREITSNLCRRWTSEPLSRQSERIGLSHLDSSSNIIR